ncbi:MAG: Ppx/GppA family phosphatase [Nitrososphaerota archaeon]|nr:Ppx/GppA family phosphatase [Nitrososphaerota archaeon]
MKVAVIDVGFNSLKMVKYRVEPDGTAKSYGQLGVMAKLGEGLESTGYLGIEPISRTIDALRLCRETASLESIKHVLLVGTSPVREAANRGEFMERVEKETGMKMRVLSGSDEALYGLLGAARAVDASNILYFDLGGGSLEVAYAERSRVRRTLSLPLGALKLTSLYSGKDGKFSRKDRAKMAERVLELLPSRRELGLARDTTLVGTGGTVRGMARYDLDENNYPLDKVHNYTVNAESVQKMSREFFKLKVTEMNKIDAIGEGRSETMAAGTLVVKMLMKRLGFRSMTVSTHGLRDGVLVEFLERSARPSDLAQREDIERLLAKPRPSGLGDDEELLNCMMRNGIIDERQRRIILAAARRGRSPDSAEADANAVFGILMSEDLPMSHEDQLLMAVSVVRSRKPRASNWIAHQYRDMIYDDAKVMKKMGACLRLLEILDKSRAQFRVAYSNGLRISVIGSEGPFPLELARTAALALATAAKKPVTIFVGVKERERHAGLVRVGR